MINNDEYDSLQDIIDELRSFVDSPNFNIDNSISAKTRKHNSKLHDNYRTSLFASINILEQIDDINEMLEKLYSLQKMDSQAKKENKFAQKAAIKIDNLKSELEKKRSKLIDQFKKSIQETKKKATTAMAAGAYDRDFIWKGILTTIHHMSKWYRVPFVPRFDEPRNFDHERKEKEIDSYGSSRSSVVDNYQKQLDTLSKMLIYDKSKIAKNISGEILEIKEALPPSGVITITESILDKLRGSKQLLLDLEDIKSLVGGTHFPLEYKDQIEKICDMLRSAIEEEKEKISKLDGKLSNLAQNVQMAQSALSTYSGILTENSRLEGEQQRIEDRTHGYYEENERLKESAEKHSKKFHEIQVKRPEEREFNEDLEMYRAREAEKEALEKIEANKKYMDERMREKPTTSLPSQYVHMKRKLRKLSEFKKSVRSEGVKL